jgi:hypothetical protein
MVGHEESVELRRCSAWIDRFRWAKLKFVSGHAPGWRHAPVWMLAGRMNARRCEVVVTMSYVMLLREPNPKMKWIVATGAVEPCKNRPADENREA